MTSISFPPSVFSYELPVFSVSHTHLLNKWIVLINKKHITIIPPFLDNYDNNFDEFVKSSLCPFTCQVRIFFSLHVFLTGFAFSLRLTSHLPFSLQIDSLSPTEFLQNVQDETINIHFSSLRIPKILFFFFKLFSFLYSISTKAPYACKQSMRNMPPLLTSLVIAYLKH